MRKALTILFAVMVGISASAQYQTSKIVAHKGYHPKGGGPSNSIEALKDAQKEKFDMVEFDVNMTSDGELLVLHGDWHPNSKAANRVHVQYQTKSKIQSIPLANGETVPTFEEWIAQATKSKKTKLLIEIKGHDTPALDTEVVEKIQEILKKYKMQDKVFYLVGHEFLVRELVRLTPKGTPIALTNDYYTPAFCHNIGCKIAGRSYGSWRKNSHLIKQARDLGMEIMVWTVNKPEEIEWCIQQGFDYVLTDNPMMMREILKTTKQ